MHIRLAELMDSHGITNAHELATRSGGRIPVTTAYRLLANGGRLDKRLSGLLEGLCEVFGVEPCELLERESSPKNTAAPKKSVVKKKTASKRAR